MYIQVGDKALQNGHGSSQGIAGAGDWAPDGQILPKNPHFYGVFCDELSQPIVCDLGQAFKPHGQPATTCPRSAWEPSLPRESICSCRAIQLWAW